MSLINYITKVEFDEGSINKLPAILGDLGVKRPLIVTDPGIVAAGLLERIPSAVTSTAALYTETPANPTEDAVLAAFVVYRDEGCDGIVGFGGGSSIDLAKGVRLLSGHEPPLSQYTAVSGGASKIHANICPLVAIPTTAGTGSEVGRATVIITSEGRKLGIISPFMVPSVAICDPDLTLGLPSYLTAATGMDAISHCLETFMAPSFNPPADAIALDGLRWGLRSIREATSDGKNADARRGMMVCALEGAMAFQKGLGAVHALTHPLGAIRELNLHHGTLNAVLMPAVLRFNRPAIGEKWAVLAEILGGEPDQKIALLTKELKLPTGLDELKVTDEMMAAVSGQALKDHCHLTNPRIPTEEQYLEMLRDSR
ncbi:4-hydroxybutyrate dehydrogenase [Brucella anthropi]|uniref:iron-containing alcohol dehydrogenase n=1 Tax=Brucella anthropi TaxID=529 RepID=UPI00044A6799|nr:iron-containing alcohol dehydrogenase [Brucella anthropi]EXL06512.1 4-hydroxybutyrate dehydrogenase [Brucella anthropi]